MSELLICGACLNNEINLIHIDSGQLRDKYNAICGVVTQHVEGASQYLCVMCVAYLNKMIKLRELCLKSAQAFQQESVKNKEDKIKCTADTLDMTPMLSFPKNDKFMYSEIYRNNVRNTDHKILYEPGLLTATLCYEVNEHINTIEATNNDKTEPKVLITENVKLDNSYCSILNENNNNCDLFENQDDMFDNNKSNTSYPDENTATNNLNDNSYIINAIDMHNNSQNIYLQDNSQNIYLQDNSQNIYLQDNSENVILENNSQSQGIVITDSIELPEEAKFHSKRLRTIEYFAKLELLPDNEAAAAHALNTRARGNITYKDYKKMGLSNCNVCNKFVFTRLFPLHKQAHEKMSIHHCSICFVNFTNNTASNHHFVINHMFKYICRICSEVSFAMDLAEIHYKDNHCSTDLEYRLKIDEIDAALRNKKDYITNYFTKTSITKEAQARAFEKRQFKQTFIDAPIKCEKCYKVFKTSQALEIHNLIHTQKQNTPQYCSICRSYFRNEYDLFQHTEHEHEYKYTCNECGYEVYKRIDAVKHRSSVHEKKKDDTTCSKRNKKIETNNELKQHMPTHYGGEKFCTVCGRIFGSKQAVAIHVSKLHEESFNSHVKATYDPDRTSQFYCGECQVQFHNAVGYNRHLTLKEHLHATIVECNTADNQIEVKTEIVYNNKGTKQTCRAMNCHLCGVFLRTGKIARDHYHKVHTLEEYRKHIYTTTYKCEQCDYTTMKPRKYRLHVRNHQIDFTLPCQICGKRFGSVLGLKGHQVVHSDERPYECEHCNKRFKTRQKTTRHIKTVHLKIPHMPWVRRAERRKRERALERQKRAEESQGKYIIKSKHKTEKEEPQQDMDVNMMDEEQYTATEYLSNFARSGNVVFATHSR